MTPLGIRVYGLGAVATGLVGLAWGDFALQWQPVAASFPGRTALAYIFAVLLVVAGIAIHWRASSAAVGAAALAGLYAVVVIFMHGAQLIQHPVAVATWNGAAEQLALVAGGLAAYACLMGTAAADRPGGDHIDSAADSGRSEPSHTVLISRVALVSMGLCLLTFGLAHFVYLDFTASMVPAWLPGGQRFWAALTGAAHLAAGLALLSGIQARLAAILLTVMFATFGVLVHLPLLIGDHSHVNWVMNAVNLALTGAAASVAARLTQTNTRRARRAAGVVPTPTES